MSGAGSKGVCPVVLACDENFAMPLATLLRSLADSNPRHWPLDVTVLNDGFSEAGRQRVEGSLPPGAATLRWCLVDLAGHEQFSPAAHLSRMTYARLQIDRFFAQEVPRVLYLDADMLVLDDIEALVAANLHGQPFGAVADDYVDDRLRRGLEPDPGRVPKVGRYFNAGMLLIDLIAWRRARIGERALEHLVQHPSTPYADQDALNVVGDGAWAALPGRWNFQGHVRTAVQSLSPAERPAIVHFITAKKPWKAECVSMNAALYASYWDKTAYRRTPLELARWSWSRFRARVNNRLKRALA